MQTIQKSLPIEIHESDIARKRSLGAAIELCAELRGFELDKTLQQSLEVDKAQFSRWLSGQEGIVWHKFSKLMDVCENDAPLLWMLYQRGYDIGSIRKRETELEKQLREANEKIAQLEHDRAVQIATIRELRVA